MFQTTEDAVNSVLRLDVISTYGTEISDLTHVIDKDTAERCVCSCWPWAAGKQQCASKERRGHTAILQVIIAVLIGIRSSSI